MATKKITKKSSKERAASIAAVKKNRARILGADSPFAVKESYIQLRTNLLFSVAATETEGGKVFAVTSANPSEGKSTTASNIAVSFAMLGKSTLLIDCDMRKPNVHKLWRIQGSNGMSNLLTGIDNCYVNEVEELPLSIISAGDIPPNPSELLASSKFEDVVTFLRNHFDYIIIDTPPVNQVADAQIIAKNVDGVVLVVSSGKTQLGELAAAQKALDTSAGKICGFILNNVNPKKGGYSYRYGSKYANKYYYSNTEN